MNLSPKAYDALYGPYRPTYTPSRGETAVAVAAGGLWALTLVSLGFLTLLVSIVAVWAAAAGEPVGGFLWPFCLTVAGAAAALTALAFAPGVRRLAPAARMLLLGALACPVPTCFALVTWARIG
ncbi:hypothetical protein ACHBTE_30165 [Streptomyces sp. M41]|uniref:hypothetical protein n=1 Tax=Streptomyces sp. M41 TaxID=3059412 RepID=UPI00374CAEA8